MAVTSLIPARFLCMISHLIVAITLLWSRDGNVKSCLPEDYTEAQYGAVDTGLLIGLILVIVFLAIEIIGFISGVSMFIHLAGLICLSVFNLLFLSMATPSMFIPTLTIGIISNNALKTDKLLTARATGAHASGSIALSYFLFEEWPCYTFWWIFSFCSVIPVVIEVILLIGIAGLKKVK